MNEQEAVTIWKRTPSGLQVILRGERIIITEYDEGWPVELTRDEALWLIAHLIKATQDSQE